MLHVHLSGGEPTARSDIVEITAECARIGFYSNLITSGVGGALDLLGTLAAAGLNHVQLSIQAADPDNAARIGGLPHTQQQKLAFGRRVAELGLALTVNAVTHRSNIAEVEDIIALAVELGARRLEIAHTKYYGWGLLNRAALMPSRADVRRSIAAVEAARARLAGRLVIDLVAPDYYARHPEASAGALGPPLHQRDALGRVLPCHATIPRLSPRT